MELERAAPEILVAEGVKAEDVSALSDKLFAVLANLIIDSIEMMFLLGVQKKRAKQKESDHKRESDLFHGNTPLA
jgi:hypothetical protein